MSIASYNPEHWTVSANDSLNVIIVSDKQAVKFNPTFTYPIFGDAEQIFGFFNLEINLAFNATTMLPLLGIKYAEKLPDDTKVEEPQKKLKEFLPDELFVNEETNWSETWEKELKDFEIPGDVIGEYEIDGITFEIYRGSLLDPEFKKLHKRIQIFVLFMIEAGSYIDDSDEKWDYFVIYEKISSQISNPKLIGFTTVYNYWKYPGAENFDKSTELLVRKKISQFVILPPYQGKYHGASLYKVLVDIWLKDSKVTEIVVEDPSESFDDLRDRCDLERLSKEGIFNLNNFPTFPISEKKLLELQEENKMEKRQFLRCLEMGLLHEAEKRPETSNKLKKNIRLQIKKRIFLKNREALLEIKDKSERLNKIHLAYQSTVDDYQRIMEKVNFGSKRPVEAGEKSDPKKQKT